MKILITGHLGFVGSETSKYIQENSAHEVVGYDIMAHGDIRDIGEFEKAVQETRPDRILHLAAIARFADADAQPRLAFETNGLGTRNVAVIAAKYHIPVVYASTGSVYMPIQKEGPIKEDWSNVGNSVYGCTKALGERYIQQYDNPYIILRYAHLYGKEKRMHGLIGGFMDRISRGLAPTLYGGKQSNDFTYIKDIARANYLALTATWDKFNQIYNIGTGEELTAEVAGDIICKATKYKGKIEKKAQRTVDPQRFQFDCSKATIMLDFKAEYSFKDGFTQMLKEIEYDEKNKPSISEYMGPADQASPVHLG